MSKLSSPEGNTQEPQWEIEEFYFGHGEWQTYRRSGDRIQFQAERALPLELVEGTHQYRTGSRSVSEFFATYDDCEFIVADSYETRDGDRQAPVLWVVGWKDLAEDERHIYEKNKAQAMKKPTLS